MESNVLNFRQNMFSFLFFLISEDTFRMLKKIGLHYVHCAQIGITVAYLLDFFCRLPIRTAFSVLFLTVPSVKEIIKFSVRFFKRISLFHQGMESLEFWWKNSEF